jgi:hypothetical protein
VQITMSAGRKPQQKGKLLGAWRKYSRSRRASVRKTSSSTLSRYRGRTGPSANGDAHYMDA